jgi:hypothetical protein
MFHWTEMVDISPEIIYTEPISKTSFKETLCTRRINLKPTPLEKV